MWLTSEEALAKALDLEEQANRIRMMGDFHGYVGLKHLAESYLEEAMTKEGMN